MDVAKSERELHAETFQMAAPALMTSKIKMVTAGLMMEKLKLKCSLKEQWQLRL